MWRLERTDTFLRTARRYLRRRRHLVESFQTAISRLEEDPHHPLLRTHALKGSLQGLHAASCRFMPLRSPTRCVSFSSSTWKTR